MLKLPKTKSMNSARAPHQSHKIISNALQSEGYTKEERARVFTKGGFDKDMYITFYDPNAKDYRVAKVQPVGDFMSADDFQ